MSGKYDKRTILSGIKEHLQKGDYAIIAQKAGVSQITVARTFSTSKSNENYLNEKSLKAATTLAERRKKEKSDIIEKATNI